VGSRTVTLKWNGASGLAVGEAMTRRTATGCVDESAVEVLAPLPSQASSRYVLEVRVKGKRNFFTAHRPFVGLSVSTDGKSILYAQNEYSQSDIVLV
jgi:hypothetical protein